MEFKKSSTIHRSGHIELQDRMRSSYPSSVKGVGVIILIAGHMVATGLSVIGGRIENRVVTLPFMEGTPCLGLWPPEPNVVSGGLIVSKM